MESLRRKAVAVTREPHGAVARLAAAMQKGILELPNSGNHGRSAEISGMGTAALPIMTADDIMTLPLQDNPCMRECVSGACCNPHNCKDFTEGILLNGAHSRNHTMPCVLAYSIMPDLDEMNGGFHP